MIDLYDLLAQVVLTYVLSTCRYVGVNASDINYTAGKYDPKRKPPFPSGFEVSGIYFMEC